VPELPGEDGEPAALSLDGRLGSGVELGGMLGAVAAPPLGGTVDGDADGARSTGRSSTRSVGDSVHPARTPAPRASAQNPVSNFFMTTPPFGRMPTIFP
jgi:hypothetical protein